MTAVSVSPPPTNERPVVHHARRDSAVRAGSGLLLWGSLLLTAFWWARDGGIGDLAGWASGLTSAGRLTGLVASVLLLAQVLLMARVPLLEQAFGQDRLARLHRLVGFTSINLMIAHIGLITYGYAAGDLASTPGEAWNLTTTYPAMLLAVAGSLCLLLATVTSIRASRRRLRYESWHLLHLYAYLGVGLALPHQLWTGQQFLGSPVATAYWWSIWALAAAAILWFRVLLPLARSARHDLRVTSVIDEGDDTHSVYVTGRRLHRLRAHPGQFFHWRFLAGEGSTRAHPYSLSAAPDGRSLRLTVKAIGDGSALVRRLRPGTKVLVEGPYGRLSPRARTREKVLLVGSGVGITPLRALLEGLEAAPGDLTLIYRYSTKPLFFEELRTLAAERGARVLLLPGHRRGDTSWLPTHVGGAPLLADDVTVLRHWVPDVEDHDVYVCGPDAWAESVRRSALAAGVPEEQFHHESFSW